MVHLQSPLLAIAAAAAVSSLGSGIAEAELRSEVAASLGAAVVSEVRTVSQMT